MKKPIWSNTEMADFASGMGNILLGFACLILIPYLVAPLFGGKFLPRALLLYGSWIGTAFIIKYKSRFIRAKIRMKQRKEFFFTLLMILFIVVWFPNYIGSIMAVLFVLGIVASYRAQGRRGWQDEQ